MDEVLTKRCSQCEQELPLFAFGRNRVQRDGLDHYCKVCRGVAAKVYRQSPRGRAMLRRFNQTETRRMSNRRYRRSEKGRRCQRRIKASAKCQATRKAYRARPEIKERVRKQTKHRLRRYRKDPVKRFRMNVGKTVSMSLRSRDGRKHTGMFKALSYTAKELCSHVESLFKPGMSWDNYGEWELDHIQPQVSFEFTSMSDPGFIECWALSNLRPLWRTENRKKGARAA